MTSKDEALKMAISQFKRIDKEYDCTEIIDICKEALEQEERTQRTMYCGTADAFIAMDDDHKRRWFVQSLRESKRRKELEDILEQPAQEIVCKVFDIDNFHSSVLDRIKFTSPQQGQGLSDEEILEIDKSIDPKIIIGKGKTLFARAIEQELKEKNNG